MLGRFSRTKGKQKEAKGGLRGLGRGWGGGGRVGMVKVF